MIGQVEVEVGHVRHLLTLVARTHSALQELAEYVLTITTSRRNCHFTDNRFAQWKMVDGGIALQQGVQRSSQRLKEKEAVKPHGTVSSHENSEDASTDESDGSEDYDGPNSYNPRKRRKVIEHAEGLKSSEKPSRKNDKLNLALRPAGAKPQKLRKSRGKVSTISNEEGHTEAGHLYTLVLVEREPVDVVIRAWWERFEQHQSSAVAELVNMVIEAAGCHTHISGEDIEDPDGCQSRVKAIQDQYQAVRISFTARW